MLVSDTSAFHRRLALPLFAHDLSERLGSPRRGTDRRAHDRSARGVRRTRAQGRRRGALGSRARSPGRNGENGATFRLHSRGASYGLTEALCDGFLLEVEVDVARSEWELDIDNGESECEGSGFLDGSRFEIEVLRPGKMRLVHPSNDIYGRMDTTLRLPES